VAVTTTACAVGMETAGHQSAPARPDPVAHIKDTSRLVCWGQASAAFTLAQPLDTYVSLYEVGHYLVHSVLSVACAHMPSSACSSECDSASPHPVLQLAHHTVTLALGKGKYSKYG
jgi:hypothetical protein